VTARAARMLAALADGPKTRADLFRHAGAFYLTNNAAAELRDAGYAVDHELVDGEHVYTLLVGGGGDVQPGTQTARTDGDTRESGYGTPASPDQPSDEEPDGRLPEATRSASSPPPVDARPTAGLASSPSEQLTLEIAA
jgi:hypothetical protein